MGIQEPRFWTLCADAYAGSIKIEVRSGLTGIVGGGPGTNDYAASSLPMQIAGQSNLQPADAARLLHDRDQFANGLVRYAQQVFGAVGVRNLYVQIDYAGDDTVHNHPHHHVNDVQRPNNYAVVGSLLDQPQQQFQAHYQQQPQQQQQYTNPLLMM